MNEQTTKITTGVVRLSYAHIWEPKAMEGQTEEKYSVSILIPKSDTETLNKINTAIQAAKVAGVEKWGGKIPANLKTPLRDGDVDREDDPNYAGHYFINANSKQKPAIVEPFKVNGQFKEITDQSRVYSGCYARVSLNFFGFNSNGNRGIGAGLGNLQFIKDGEPLSGRSNPEADFDEYEYGDEGGLLD